MEEGDIVLCTVKKIQGTLVFVDIENENKQGSIIFSEIAPGRIRNIRNYVVPKKKIACKVLNVNNNPVHLSLRRVNKKEREQVMQEYKQEKSYKSIFKTILKEKAEEILKKIKEKDLNLQEFIEKSKEDPKELEKIAGKTPAKKILEIINKQKSKKQVIKKQIKIFTKEPDGLNKIKEILNKIKDVSIKYISAGNYSIKKESESLKKDDQELTKKLEDLQKQAKKENVEIILKKA